MFTLRYKKDTPAYPRPHAPTVRKFHTREEAEMHRAEYPNAADLEVVER